MTAVLLNLGLLALVATGAGALVLRYFRHHLPFASRLALMPVLGAAVVALSLFAVFLVIPLGPAAVSVAFLPAVAGAVVTPWRHWKRLRRLPVLVVALLIAVATALVLVPFTRVGGAEAFGIYNNDAYWFGVQDWRVSMHSYFRSGPVPFSIGPEETWAKRWGLNYLSVFLRHMLGLRSYQTAQIVAAFGLVLTACSTFALARVARVHWAAALLCAFAAAGNHFSYKLFVDGMLGFSFGMPFAIALLALLLRRANSTAHGILVGLAAAGLTVTYYELVPVFGVILAVSVYTRYPRKWPWKTLRSGTAVWLAATGILLPPMLVMARYASGSKFAAKYFDLARSGPTLAHLLGTVDVLQYLEPHSSPAWWQYAGAVLVAFCAVRFRSSNPVLPAVATAVVLTAYLLFVKDLEYQANRMLSIAWILAPAVIFGWMRRWRDLTIGLLALLFVLSPVAPLTARAASSLITTSERDREVGRWLATVPDSAKVLIDLPDDQQIWYSHWMYLEAVHRFRGDDRQILVPHIGLSYIYPPRPEPAKMDFTGATYVLRRHVLGRVSTDEELIAQNDKYRFYRLRQPLFWVRSDGFHGIEPSGGGWMQQDGRIIVHSGSAGDRSLSFTAGANPAIPLTKLTVIANGHPAGDLGVVVAPRDYSVRLPLHAGRNEIVLHSERDPIPPGNGDGRLMSVYVGPVTVR